MEEEPKQRSGSPGAAMEGGTNSSAPAKDPRSIARKYQLDLCKRALVDNIIVYLGTGCGKTHIAVLLMYELGDMIRKPSTGVCIFLAPTVPLVRQDVYDDQIGISRKRTRTSILTGRVYMNELLKWAEIQFREICRMNKHNFSLLCNEIRDLELLKESTRVDIEEMVIICIYILAKAASNRTAQDRFQHSGEIISRRFHEVLDALVKSAPKFIYLPPANTLQYILDRQYFRFFKDCIGAIDRTHILTEIPANDRMRYRNRKGSTSQNVMDVCSFDMRFLFINAGYEGSAADATVLEGALTSGFYVPEGKYYLVDADYANTPQFIAPYRGVRYHLKEYGPNHIAPQNLKELFNLRHASLRNVIERMFGVLKERFHIFLHPLEYPLHVQSKIIIAVCTLHNFIRDHRGGKDEIWMQIEREHDTYIDREVIRRRQERIRFEEQQRLTTSHSQRRLVKSFGIELYWKCGKIM